MNPDVRFPTFAWRVTACHVATYFVAGILAYSVMDYRGLFQESAFAGYFRSIDSPWIAAGPALQLVRGMIIAAALYAFRDVFLRDKAGMWKLTALLIGLSALSASGAAPSSFEGVVYSRLTPVQHLRGLPELVVQNVLFAYGLTSWCRRPARGWNIGMGLIVALIVLMSIAGVLAALGVLKH